MSGREGFELEDKHKRAILDRDYPHIPLSVEDAEQIEAGQIIVLKPFQVWITLLGPAKDRRKRLYLLYRVRDDRPRFMRRNPHGMDVADVKSRMDSYGTPQRVSDQDAAEAEEASHYTGSPKLAVAEEAEEVVPAEYQTVLSMQGRSRQADQEQAERAEQLNRQRVRSLNRALTDTAVLAARQGVDATPVFARIERELQVLAESLEAAA